MSAKRWRAFALAVLACVALGVLAVVGVIAMNWSRITTAARTAASSVAELRQVQTRLQEEYQGAQISVVARHHSGAAGPILSIRVVNAPFAKDLSHDALQEKASEVAATARDSLTSPDEFSLFEVVFVQQVRAGATFSSSQAFRFRGDDLPPPD